MVGIIAGENQRIVLVGVQGLFVTTFAAQGNPAEAVHGNLGTGRRQLDDALIQMIVQRRQQPGQIFGFNSFIDQAGHQFADFVRGLAQFRFGLGVDDQVMQVRAVLQGIQQVAVRDHPGKVMVVIQQYDAADPAPMHFDHGVKAAGTGGQSHQGVGHHFANGGFQIDLGHQNPTDQIAAGEDADRRAILDDDHFARLGGVQFFDHLIDTGLRRQTRHGALGQQTVQIQVQRAAGPAEIAAELLVDNAFTDKKLVEFGADRAQMGDHRRRDDQYADVTMGDIIVFRHQLGTAGQHLDRKGLVGDQSFGDAAIVTDIHFAFDDDE